MQNLLSARMLRQSVVSVLLVLVLTLLPFTSIQALDLRNEDFQRDFVVYDDVEDDLVVFNGEKVIIQGNIGGDLLVAGGSVVLNGAVQDNVIVAGGKLLTDGKIGKTLYAVAGEMDIKGQVGRNLVASGGDIQVNSRIEEDVIVAGGTVNLNGTVGDDVRVVAGRVDLNSEVGGNVLASGGMLRINGNIADDLLVMSGEVDIFSEKINGDVTVYTDNRDMIKLSELTEIGGEYQVKEALYMSDVKFDQKDLEELTQAFWIGNFWFRIGWSAIQAIGLLLLGFLLLKFMPVRINGTVDKMMKFDEVLKSLLTGILAFPTAALLALVLSLSLFGLPVLKALGGLAFFAFAIVYPVAALALGRVIMKAANSRRRYLIPLGVGLVILQLLRLIPFVSGFVHIVLTAVVIGALLRYQYAKYKQAQVRVTKVSKA